MSLYGPTKVAIIKTKGWGMSQSEDYDRFISAISGSIKLLKTKKGEKRAEVKIFENIKEVAQWLDNKGFVMFISRGDLETAEKFAADNPKVKTLLVTGLVPEGRIILLDKIWVDLNFLENLIP